MEASAAAGEGHFTLAIIIIRHNKICTAFRWQNQYETRWLPWTRRLKLGEWRGSGMLGNTEVKCCIFLSAVMEDEKKK